MYISRSIVTIPPANRERALAMLKEQIGSIPASHPPLKVQVMASALGRWDQICTDMYFESLAHYEQFWAEALPQIPPEWAREWWTIPVPGGTNEIWEVVFEHSD